jgi:hypothetical protein
VLHQNRAYGSSFVTAIVRSHNWVFVKPETLTYVMVFKYHCTVFVLLQTNTTRMSNSKPQKTLKTLGSNTNFGDWRFQETLRRHQSESGSSRASSPKSRLSKRSSQGSISVKRSSAGEDVLDRESPAYRDIRDYLLSPVNLSNGGPSEGVDENEKAWADLVEVLDDLHGISLQSEETCLNNTELEEEDIHDISLKGEEDDLPDISPENPFRDPEDTWKHFDSPDGREYFSDMLDAIVDGYIEEDQLVLEQPETGMLETIEEVHEPDNDSGSSSWCTQLEDLTEEKPFYTKEEKRLRKNTIKSVNKQTSPSNVFRVQGNRIALVELNGAEMYDTPVSVTSPTFANSPFISSLPQARLPSTGLLRQVSNPERRQARKLLAKSLPRARTWAQDMRPETPWNLEERFTSIVSKGFEAGLRRWNSLGSSSRSTVEDLACDDPVVVNSTGLNSGSNEAKRFWKKNISKPIPLETPDKAMRILGARPMYREDSTHRHD